MFDITSAESFQQQLLAQQPLNQTLLEVTITSPNRPITYDFKGIIRKRKTQKQALEKRKKREEAAQNYSKTRNPRFQYNLNYILREDVNQWKTIFWVSRRREFTIENRF